MPDLTTTYLGLQLRTPLIAGSCTFTSSVDSVKKLEAHGAAAVVLKSIFEEQIRHDVSSVYDELETADSLVAYEYLSADYPMQLGPEKYLERVEGIKGAVGIPVIASINCQGLHEWGDFAQRVADAGADALEVNIYDIPDHAGVTGTDIEQKHIDIVRAVLDAVRIPVSVKLSPFYSSLLNVTSRIDALGAQGLVLFNRFFQPDIDVDALQLKDAVNYSRPEDIRLPLRWVAMLHAAVEADLCLTTGIHDAAGAAKALLAGASAVQVCSVLYTEGFSAIGTILDGLGEWMTKHGFGSIQDVQGKLGVADLSQRRGFERAQYVRTFAGLE